MGCVYLVKNIYNKKCYIGKTIGTLQKRKNNHYNDTKENRNMFNSYFHNALRKCKDHFEWCVLYKSKNNEDLIRKEIYFIKKYKTKRPNGYNLTDGGDGMTGYVFSEVSIRKMSESHKGQQPAMKGRHHSKESKEKMSKSHIGRSNGHRSEATKIKISKKLKGHSVSQTVKDKISKKLKGRKTHPCSEETKQKLRESNLGQHRSKEARERMSKARTGVPRKEETKKKISNTLKGRIFSEEWKKKISESKKGVKVPALSISLKTFHIKRKQNEIY